MIDDWPIALALKDDHLESKQVHVMYAQDYSDLLPYCESDCSITVSPDLKAITDGARGNLVTDYLEIDEIPPKLSCLILASEQKSESLESIILVRRPTYLKISGGEIDSDSKDERKNLSEWNRFLLRHEYIMLAVIWNINEFTNLPFVESVQRITDPAATLSHGTNLIASRNNDAYSSINAATSFLVRFNSEQHKLIERVQALEKFADDQSKAIINLQERIAEML